VLAPRKDGELVAYVIGTAHAEAIKWSLELTNLNTGCDEISVGLLRASLIGDVEAVRTFLSHGASVNAVDNNGRTALMEAVFGGQLETIRELLDRGVDVNAQDNDGWTALMEAGAKGRLDVVRILLAHGANPRITNKNGWTALRTTAKCNTAVSRVLRNAAH
jgi:ankyrin repeat protein